MPIWDNPELSKSWRKWFIPRYSSFDVRAAACLLSCTDTLFSVKTRPSTGTRGRNPTFAQTYTTNFEFLSEVIIRVYNQRLSRSIISQIWCAEWGKRECSSYLLIQNMGDTLKLQTVNCATSTNVNELDTTGKTNTDILKTPWAWWIFMTTNEGLLS